MLYYVMGQIDIHKQADSAAMWEGHARGGLETGVIGKAKRVES